MKRHFIKVPGGLRPAHDADERWLAKKKTGAFLELEIREPRNGALHRKWWALCNYLAEHHSGFPDSEKASKWMLKQLGYCTEIRTSRGVERIADSISWASMDDDTFSAMYSRACDLLCEIIPMCTDENVAQVLAEFAGVGSIFTHTSPSRAAE
jgi:hypothetical protein